MSNVDKINELKARLEKCVAELDSLIENMKKELKETKN